ncbi:ESX secretion-associated protein EspG [Pseudonocardia endophytica]|uniref:ESAT-6 protein secretion system EspG family protein n=1 Tax=Pseudonocardia endophytica TaxID=401976 RepID=A0A4R1I594_PSEEN|nr:ESX secretion-associated protein EspG [Pseudonocardia endophytica]TCK27779.1 ESAT-6 protein secretion system EspG family protein [Pseudonocardia endophytica]
MSPGPLRLSVAEIDVLCTLLALDPPDALELHDRGEPALTDARDDLAARGLLERAGIAATVAATLRRLCCAPLAVELDGPRGLHAVAGVDAATGVLAVRHGDDVALRALPSGRAISAVPELLGPLRPAVGRPVRVPVAVVTDAVAAAGEDTHRLVVELMRRGVSGAGARTLVDANREVRDVSRIGVTLRHADGVRHGPYRITVQRTASGHRCQRPCAGPPGALVTAPATGDRLASEIEELIRVTARGQRRGAGRGSTRPADTGGIGSRTGASTW